MDLTQQRIEEFRTLYKKAYGQDITAEDARAMAFRLIELYRMMMRPLGDERPSRPDPRT